MAKARLKQAVIKILTKLQAYHIQERIHRNKHCLIPVKKFVKDYNKVPQNYTEYTRNNQIQIFNHSV
jgi:hypothetical protein